MKLLYVTNTRIPSKKANSYQSLQMADNFCRYISNFEFLVADRKFNYEFDDIDNINIFQFYKLKNKFLIKKISCIDSEFLHDINQNLWFYIHSFTFAINLISYIRKKNEYYIFIRDEVSFKLLSFFKKLGIIKNKIFFESHRYNENLIPYINNIEGLIVINSYLKKLYSKKTSVPILVAHDGVNLDEFKNITFYEFKKKEEYNILYAGNLFEWKGVYTLVDSLEFLDNVNLYIVGGSDDVFRKFKEYCEKKSYKDKINLVGFIERKKLVNYINKADVLVLPNSKKDKMSFYTSPLKLFEYMASRRPIIASNLPSLMEILEDKKNSILFEADNERDLAEKINYCISNDMTYIVDNAYKDVLNFTWEKRAYNIIKFMKKVSNER
jgi:glycosyltransferase involved in cell wall biosynthesis